MTSELRRIVDNSYHFILVISWLAFGLAIFGYKVLVVKILAIPMAIWITLNGYCLLDDGSLGNLEQEG